MINLENKDADFIADIIRNDIKSLQKAIDDFKEKDDFLTKIFVEMPESEKGNLERKYTEYKNQYDKVVNKNTERFQKLCKALELLYGGSGAQ